MFSGSQLSVLSKWSLVMGKTLNINLSFIFFKFKMKQCFVKQLEHNHCPSVWFTYISCYFCEGPSSAKLKWWLNNCRKYHPNLTKPLSLCISTKNKNQAKLPQKILKASIRHLHLSDFAHEVPQSSTLNKLTICALVLLLLQEIYNELRRRWLLLKSAWGH